MNHYFGQTGVASLCSVDPKHDPFNDFRGNLISAGSPPAGKAATGIVLPSSNISSPLSTLSLRLIRSYRSIVSTSAGFSQVSMIQASGVVVLLDSASKYSREALSLAPQPTNGVAEHFGYLCAGPVIQAIAIPP